ncbi:PfkB family carbohydrate kinase [Turicibacter sanguinis]|uniref:PfkB family carbohydrate kinase n=1 Tax=Turicibacter sanguinis TaxID=154288 RepID=UPI00294312F6|nr:PfkB family carbohydrate kinase [Turicibacter sanguinis]
MKTLLLGNAIVDVILNIDVLPKTGDDIFCQKQSVTIGGCAYNVATILNHFDVEHDLAVPVGSGSYASMIKEELIKHGYPVHIEEQTVDNGYCLCLVEHHGERTFITVPGVEANYQRRWLDAFSGEQYDNIYISGYEMEGLSGAIISQWLSTQEIKNLYFAPGPRITFIEQETMERLFKLHPILHINQSEALRFTKEQDLNLAVRKLYALTHNELFITLGEHGVLHFDGENQMIIEAPKTTVVNTIGAGDSHLGAIIALRSLGYETKQCCEIANKVAAKVVSLQSSKFEEEYFNKGDFLCQH